MIYSMTGYAAVSEELVARHAQRRSALGQSPLSRYSVPPARRVALVRARHARAGRRAAEPRQGRMPRRLHQESDPDKSRSQLNTALFDQLVELDRHVRDRSAGRASLTVSDVIRWPGIVEADAISARAIARADASRCSSAR